MILIAVIVGYILGVIPFIIINLLERRERKFEILQDEKQVKEQAEIFNEWLNGKEPTQEQATHINLFDEYMTGKVTAKGDE